MNTYNISINLYKLSELSGKAQAHAIEEHRYFMLSDMTPDDFISGDPEYDTPEELQKTYDAEYDYILFNDEPVIESIDCNEYLFFENGDIANIRYKFQDGTLESRETYVKMCGIEYRIA